jgi:hypothetical protein
MKGMREKDFYTVTGAERMQRQSKARVINIGYAIAIIVFALALAIIAVSAQVDVMKNVAKYELEVAYSNALTQTIAEKDMQIMVMKDQIDRLMEEADK